MYQLPSHGMDLWETQRHGILLPILDPEKGIRATQDR